MITSQEISLLILILGFFGSIGFLLILVFIHLGKKDNHTTEDYDMIELAEYNRRCHLGIIHDKRYRDKMEKLQKQFDDAKQDGGEK